MDLVRVRFIIYGISLIARTSWISALYAEVFNHAMENRAVIIALED